MKAICVRPDRSLMLRELPTPGAPPPEHVVVRMETCAINPGDKFFLGAAPGRSVPGSKHEVWGVSGSGTVTAVGTGVPPEWMGRNVTVYRSLSASEHTVGTWCEVALLPMRCCALIPTGLDPRDFSGSLVNVITAYAFAKQVQADGHRGVLITAGTSATGLALAGISGVLGLPAVAIVRSEAGREKLRAMGVEDVLVSDDASFDQELSPSLERRGATAVFDGVGGALLSRLLPRLVQGSTVYSYGYLGGGDVPVQIPTQLLMGKGLALRSFSNFASPTVRDPRNLQAALQHIGELLALPHCKTSLGRAYRFDQVDEALAAVGKGEGKPVLLAGP